MTALDSLEIEGGGIDALRAVRAIEADLSLALDLLEKHQWDAEFMQCVECRNSGDKLMDTHDLGCALALLLSRHGREVRWQK